MHRRACKTYCRTFLSLFFKLRDHVWNRPAHKTGVPATTRSCSFSGLVLLSPGSWQKSYQNIQSSRTDTLWARLFVAVAHLSFCMALQYLLQVSRLFHQIQRYVWLISDFRCRPIRMFSWEKQTNQKNPQNRTNKQNPLQNHHSLHSEKVLQTIHIWLCLLNLAKSVDLGLRSLLAAQSWVGYIPWPMLNRMITEWNLAIQI